MYLFTSTDETNADAATGQANTTRTETATRRIDRPATAILRKADAAHTGSGLSPALEALDGASPADTTADAVARLRRPVRNLAKLFQLVQHDIDALPILQSEMLFEAHHQMRQIEQVIDGLAGDAGSEAAPSAQRIFDALRQIRTPLANMEGVLSLVLDDRAAMPRPVTDMLLVACEQLAKLARTADLVGERLNLAHGLIAVHYRDSALEQIIELAIRNAREESFEAELVTANQVAADVLPEIDAARSQCLEALLRHALLDTTHYANTQPVGLFVYVREAADGALQLAVEVHDHSERDTAAAAGRPASLDFQIVQEMTQALQGECRRETDRDHETVLTICLPFAPFSRPAADAPAAEIPADTAEETTALTNAYRGVALLGAGRPLAQIIEHAVAQQLMIERVDGFDALIAALETTWLPTVFVDADLIHAADKDAQARFTAAAERVPNLFILQHAEADATGFCAQFPLLWDDDLLALAGMLEQPFQPGTQQENLVLLTGDNSAEMRPWRKLLSATGHGAMWWPAHRPIQPERFPSMIGSVVVLAATTRALPAANWQALAQLKVRDRRVLVLTGHDTCQLNGSRGWDIYRPNLQACDDTLRRYILFNSPARQAPRVAVIEDDLLMRKLLSAAVEDQAQITEIATVAEALEKLRTQSFDVILLDLYLPDGSGLKILETIRQDPRLAKAARTPILTLTANSELDINRQALELGAAEVLVKPVPMQVLRQKIALLTRRNRSTRISGPVTIPTDSPATPAAPAANAANADRPRASKIINLRRHPELRETPTRAIQAGAGD